MSAVFKSLFELLAEITQLLTGSVSVFNKDARIKEIEKEIFNIDVPGIEEDKSNLKQDRLKVLGIIGRPSMKSNVNLILDCEGQKRNKGCKNRTVTKA